MEEIGNKERIIMLLNEYESGLTYNNLLIQFKKKYGEELNNGYVYLKRLKNDGLIETFKTPNTKGKTITYKLRGNKLSIKEIKIKDVQILKDTILEYNKLMSIIRPKIPISIDKNKIKKGIEKCHTI